MFLDLNNNLPRRQPERPQSGKRSVMGEEKFLIGIVMLNLVAALIAPIGGATIVQALVSLFR